MRPPPLSTGFTEPMQVETDLIDAIQKRHVAMTMILKTRLSTLRQITDRLYDGSQCVETLKHVQTLKDPSVKADILKIVQMKKQMMTLESASVLFQLVSDLLQGVYEEYVYW